MPLSIISNLAADQLALQLRLAENGKVSSPLATDLTTDLEADLAANLDTANLDTANLDTANLDTANLDTAVTANDPADQQALDTLLQETIQEKPRPRDQ
jgi:uncharacterized protein YjbI with pentapeptide repeats